MIENTQLKGTSFMFKKAKAKLLLLLLLLCASQCYGLVLAETNLTTNEKAQVISNLAKELKNNYVYPDNGLKMSALLLKNMNEGKYANIIKARGLSEQLTQDVHSIYHDKHLRVIYDPSAVEAMQDETVSADDPMAEINFLASMQRNNFGFNQVKILPGNIGYIDLHSFSSAQPSQDTAAAAMKFVENTDAMIIDLRKNTGGDPAMVALLASYFFADKPVHLGGFYWRPTDSYSENFTLADITGKHRPDVPLYILTSNRTFSAAEDFSYSLKHLKRATIVGEVTGGGAHPVGPYVIGKRFFVSLPQGRSTNPITKKNWEGVGVQPDLKLVANQALLIAQQQVLKSLLEEDDSDSATDSLQWALIGIEAELAPTTLSNKKLKSYSGKFGRLEILYQNKQLHLVVDNRPNRVLTPLSHTLFKLPDSAHIRLEFEVKNEQVVGLYERFDDGFSRYTDKSS